MTNTYLISVRPAWASDFFLSHKPKTIELRKGSFGASLKPGDNIAIYATMPTGDVIGTVRFVKCKILPVEQLWQASQQGKLARVSRQQFDDYYRNQSSGVGVWVESAQLLPKPIPLHRLRDLWGVNWNPPQQIIQLSEPHLALIKGGENGI